jgi:transcriptional regulator with XRE-family HTH domain
MRGYKQEKLAELAGMPATTIGHFEAGTRKPSFDSLRKLAVALEITTDYLMGRVDDPELAEAGDPLFRDVAKLSGNDREIAKGFLKMLAERNSKRDKGS